MLTRGTLILAAITLGLAGVLAAAPAWSEGTRPAREARIQAIALRLAGVPTVMPEMVR